MILKGSVGFLIKAEDYLLPIFVAGEGGVIGL